MELRREAKAGSRASRSIAALAVSNGMDDSPRVSVTYPLSWTRSPEARHWNAEGRALLLVLVLVLGRGSWKAQGGRGIYERLLPLRHELL